MGERSCVLAEARKVYIVLQQFLGFIAEAVVERVDEVEADSSCDQFETRGPPSRYVLRVNTILLPYLYYLTVKTVLTS